MDGEWKHIAVALFCAASVSVLLLKWRGKQKVKRKLQRVREKREKELEQAEEAVRRFRTQVRTLASLGSSPRFTNICVIYTLLSSVSSGYSFDFVLYTLRNRRELIPSRGPRNLALNKMPV